VPGRAAPGGVRTGLLQYERVLPHSPERVWEALTSPADLRQWMAADDVVLEGRVGGRFALHGLIDGEGQVLAWDPPRRFEHEFRLTTESGPKQGGIVAYQLRPEGPGTHLTMTFRSLSPALSALFLRGQSVTFDRIEAHLAGRPMPEFPGA